MDFARTVTMFLMDGTPKGRIKCSFDNWVGKVFLIPRTELKRSEERSELSQTGIYLLFGTNPQTGEEQVYVGQARERMNGKGVLARVMEHRVKDKFDYFSHAILIIDSPNTFGPTEISYLENAFYQRILAADRIQVINGNNPSPGNVTEEKEAELNQFIANAKILIGSLGYHIFDEVDENKPTSEEVADTSASGTGPWLYLKASGVEAVGRQTTEGFVVYPGSKLREPLQPSAPAGVRKNREELADRIENLELTRKTLFSSPSAASSFILGYSSSGPFSWKTADGISLRELEETEIEQVELERPDSERVESETTIENFKADIPPTSHSGPEAVGEIAQQ